MTSKNSKRFDDVRPGEALPELAIPITTTLIASAAIATRDYFPGHHDMEAAQQLGSPHVFMNILTTSGLTQRFIEGWAVGALQDLKIKLGAPNYGRHHDLQRRGRPHRRGQPWWKSRSRARTRWAAT